MVDEEGPQAPVGQGAHNALAPRDPPPPQYQQISLIPNAPQVPPGLEACIYPHLICPY